MIHGLSRKVTAVLMVPFGAALLAVLMVSHFLIRTQSAPAHLNLSGSQRMLALQIGDLVAGAAAGVADDRQRLRDRIDLYERTLGLLRAGGRLDELEIAPVPGDVQPLVADLDRQWQRVRPLVTAVAEGRGVDAAAVAGLRTLLQGLLHDADRLTTALDRRTERLRRQIQHLFGYGLGVTSLCLLGGLWYTRRRIIEPIARIEEVARNFGEGNYSVRLAVKSRDELGQLAGTFNGLAERVQELVEALQRDRQAALQHSEALGDLLPLGTAVVGDDLAVLRTNKVFANLIGRLEDEICGRRVHELLPPAGLRDQLLALLAVEGPPRRIAVELTLPVGVRHLRITAARMPVPEADGRLLLVVEDLTEELRLRAEARAFEESFRRLIEAAPDAIVALRDRGIVYVNPALVASLGFGEAKELVGRSFVDLVAPEDRPSAIRQIEAADRTAAATPPLEYRLLRRDGGPVWMEAATVRLDFHGASAVAVVARDVSERKQLLLKMMEMDRMIAIGTLAAGVGHEINNPLSYVIANLDLLSEELPKAALACRERQRAAGGDHCTADVAGTLDEASGFLSEARQGAVRVRNIVRELRALARVDRERTALVDLRRVLQSAVNMTWNEVRHRARLLKDIEDLPAVQGNEAQLGQAFINLLVNAAQAIPEGAAERHTIRITARTAGDSVVVEIADSGAGIEAAHRPHLFEPFFTTKAVGQGTGLGLTICRNTIEAHGGSIAFDSEVGRGTTFRVTLPAARRDPVPAAPAPTTAEAAPTTEARRGRLLIIDDDSLVCRSLERALAGDHDVTALTDARVAHRMLLDGQRFDLVLCDLMMPEMTGMDLYEAVRSVAPEQAAKFIFITGGAFTPKAMAFLDEVTNLRLDKPLDLRNLRALVRKLLA